MYILTSACVLYRVLAQVFHHSDYKGKQKEIIDAAMQGTFIVVRTVSRFLTFMVSGNDVFVVAPTGMGKVIMMAPASVAGLTK